MFLREFLYEVIHESVPLRHYGVSGISFAIWPDLAQLVLEAGGRSAITLGQLELQAIADIFAISPCSILIPEWEEISAGCDTCGHDSWGRLTVKIPAASGLAEAESRIPAVISALRQERQAIAEEERRQQAIRQAQWAKEEAERKLKAAQAELEKKMKLENEKLTLKFGLLAFNQFENNIFSALVEVRLEQVGEIEALVLARFIDALSGDCIREDFFENTVYDFDDSDRIRNLIQASFTSVCQKLTSIYTELLKLHHINLEKLATRYGPRFQENKEQDKD